MTYLRCTLVVLVAVVVMGLGGCTKKEESSAGSMSSTASVPVKREVTTPENLPHPCTLVTDADAEAILGPGAKVVRESDSECDLQAKNIFDGGSMSIKIEPAPEDWAGDKEMATKFDKNAKSVSGFGDDAYTFMGGMIILKGKASINVIATAYKGKQMPKDKAVEYVGKRVLAKM